MWGTGKTWGHGGDFEKSGFYLPKDAKIYKKKWTIHDFDQKPNSNLTELQAAEQHKTDLTHKKQRWL